MDPHAPSQESLPTGTVPRRSRFTLDSERFQRHPWVQKVSYCLRPKRLEVYWFEFILPDGTIPLHDYLTQMVDRENTDRFTLRNFDETGRRIGKVEFDGCRLADHIVEFNYASDEPIIHRVIFDFEFARYAV